MTAPVRDTAAAIRDALHQAQTTEVASRIKNVVAQSLAAVDVGVSVSRTDYFNHSFAPDLVLSWPREPGREDRFVFLRFNDDPAWIAEELPQLEKRRPLIFGLAETPVTRETELLAEESRTAETLVTDPVAVDHLRRAHATGLESLVGRSIVRGGRGLIAGAEAGVISAEITNGFVAARTADADTTRVAASAARAYLRPSESDRVTRFLFAMWLGSGASADTFPADRPAGRSSDPGDEGMRFLIESEEIADQEFWRAIGARLTLERLAGLGVAGSPPNLRHVVTANLDRLWARACKVRADQARLDDDPHSLVWRMELGLLALSGSNFTAYLGTRQEDIDQIKSDDSVGVTVETLRARAQAVSIESLELTNGQRVVTYGSADQSDVTRDDQLPEVARALGTATVRKAAVTVSGRHLELDFVKGTIGGRTNSQPPLTDILGVGLPMLWPLASTDWAAFRAMFEAAREQQTIDLYPPDLGGSADLT